ncbi:hypothetical protein [Serratia sp. 2723]|uniref:hypothetical protein n=1 Tax=unclassified Serratia (in: enterobacteria) TaxID=2647522 RepID=UPI003D2055CA
MSRYLHGSLLAVAGLATCLISGCQAQGHSERSEGMTKPVAALGTYVPISRMADKSAVTGASHSPEGSNAILTCQRDLDSLKRVNDKAWTSRKADFDALVSGVSVYASVRGNVNVNTRDTLDSLYRYKTNQICAQIERDVLDGLISRGESIR